MVRKQRKKKYPKHEKYDEIEEEFYHDNWGE